MLNNNKKSLYQLDPEIRYGFPYVLPGIIITMIVFAFPLFYSLVISMKKWILYRPQDIKTIGLSNFIYIFTKDDKFWGILENTLIFVAGSAMLSIFFGFLYATILNRRNLAGKFIPGRNLIRVALILPFVMAPSVSGTLFRVFVFEYDFGLVNYVLGLVGISPIGWLITPNLAMFSLIMIEVWREAPLAMLVLDAAISSLPRAPFEAASIDGATEWQQLLFITLPYIRPQLLFLTLTHITLAFRQFDLIFMLTGGGPASATTVLNLYVYEEAMLRANMGYANALGIVTTLIIAVICLTFLRWLGTREEFALEK